jgi:hypothetical protein
MISKIVHLIKYGTIGCLAGGLIKFLSCINDVGPTTMALLIWAGGGMLLGLLYALMIEKWFNEIYHD